MRQPISILFLLLPSGCQIDPYIHIPTWAGTNWHDAGIRDVIPGYVIKDNETPADNYNNPDVNRTEYLKDYTERRRKTCQQNFVYARSLTGETLPPNCGTIENADQLHNT